MAAIVGALGMLVVGVSLLAVPPDAATRPKTRVEGVFAVASPSPAARTAEPSPAPSSAPSPAVTAVAAPAPFSATGPSRIRPWTTADYRVVLSGSGSRSVDIWWTGAAMGNWTWQRLDGHCELTPSRDRLSGTAVGRVVVELLLTPSGAPGGQLVIEASVEGGPTYALAVATVG